MVGEIKVGKIKEPQSGTMTFGLIRDINRDEGAACVTWCPDQAYIEPRKNVTNRDLVLEEAPVYVIRTYYTVSFSYSVPGIYYRIYWRNNKRGNKKMAYFAWHHLRGQIVARHLFLLDFPTWEHSGPTLVSIRGVHPFPLALCCC